jgi:arylsulfatase A-like enzyme
MRFRSRALACALSLSIAAAPLQAAARVILFGIDGGSWPLVDRGIAAGELPNLAALAARGVTAEMTTVEPVISPVVWTSIATGRSPAVHGVTDFFRNRTHVRVPTVFERLAARGQRVGLYEYLVTWPPRTLPNGFVIPDWLRRDDRVTPPDVFARAGLAPYFYRVDGVNTLAEFAANAEREAREKPQHFTQLASAFQLDVGAVTFYSADATGHRFWRAAFPAQFDPPQPSAEEARFPNTVAETLRGIDTALGQVVASLGPDDAIVVVSDHGFQADPKTTRVWTTRVGERLGDLGLAAARDAFEIDGAFLALTLRVLPGPADKREPALAQIVAALESLHGADGEALLDVDVFEVAERPYEARPSLWRRLRAAAVRLVMTQFYGIGLDRPAYAYVVARPRDAALAAVWPDGEITAGARRFRASELFGRDDFTGRHHETALFLAAGGPIAHVAARDRVSVLDVAPLLFHLAGAPVPDDLEGAVPARLLDPAKLAVAPIRVAPAAELPGLPPEAAGAEVDDAVLMERLRALGYAQ